MKQWLFIFLILLIACSSNQRKEAPKLSKAEKKAAYLALRDEYKESMETFFEQLGATEKSSDYYLYYKLWNSLLWGVVEENDAMNSLETGVFKGSLAMIYDIDHPVSKDEMHPSFSTWRDGGKNFIFIKPDKVSDQWKVFVILHELSHLNEYATFTMTSESTELAAYSLEFKAMEELTKGYFSKVIEKELSRLEIKNLDHLQNIRIKGNDRLQKTFERINYAIFSDETKSIREIEMKMGFFATSMFLVLTKEMKLTPKEKNLKFLAFLDNIDKRNKSN